ncbi:Mo-dependent nitrogenase C-terminal domain-containing protein [Gloeocapsa sp. BRSZ]|jgi:hypothetical protein|nr:Mo-dependent nitrogenase C-terminal domain-containing protein [Scytonema hyalinum WJT4-NPBG1]
MLLIPQIPRNFSLRSWGDRLYQVSKSRLDQIEIQNRKVARLLCQLIPAQCPFERDLILFGRIIAHIPPLCKLNPFYEEIMMLRFKALQFLADVCREDVTIYC